MEVTSFLGDKTPIVQGDEGGEFIEDPAERQISCTETNTKCQSHPCEHISSMNICVLHVCFWDVL